MILKKTTKKRATAGILALSICGNIALACNGIEDTTLQNLLVQEPPKSVTVSVRDIDYLANNQTEEIILLSKGYEPLKSDTKIFEYYIPTITLDYADEHMTMPYKYQKHLYLLCEEHNVNYFLMMGIIARESRFDEDPAGNELYLGYMQVGASCEEFVQEYTGDYTLDRTDPMDNLTIGVTFYSYLYNKYGNEYSAIWAYGTGETGYANDIARGEKTNTDVEKAYKFKTLLMDKQLNPRQRVAYSI